MINIMKEYYVYKYTFLLDGTILYIGKTDSSLRQRIDAHAKEDKFRPYLDQWKIEYIKLANRVETDIVEKFLINELKPILNEKDLESGLTNMSIKLPKWESYEKYVNQQKNKYGQLCIENKKIALQNDELFQNIYTAILEDKDYFYSIQVHPTGILPLDSGKQRVTKTNVIYTNSQYKTYILKEFIKEILSFPHKIQMNIWTPVAELWDFNEKENIQYQNLKKAINFANKLYTFKQNGFQQDCDSERDFLFINKEKNIELIFHYYKDLFYQIIDGRDNYYIEINEDGYQKLPMIIEEIAKDTLIFFKVSGIIDYYEKETNIA